MVLWREIDNIFDAVLESEVEQVFCLIAMGIEKRKTPACMNVLNHAVMQKGGLPHPCFAAEIYMPTHIRLNGKKRDIPRIREIAMVIP